MPRRAAAKKPTAQRKRAQPPRGKSATVRASRDNNTENVPSEYRELLVEAATDGSDEQPARPLKRRRVGERPAFDEAIRPEILPSDLDSDSEEFEDALPQRQTITRDSQSESESDIEFEDVTYAGDSAGTPVNEGVIQGVSITLGKENAVPSAGRGGSKKRVVTAAEKQMRLGVHKIYICCLLHHNFVRNNYCNDHVTQAALRGLLNNKTKSMLVPKRDFPQSRRTALFTDGLNAVNSLWKTRWKVTHAGLRRPHWASSSEELKGFRLNDQVEVALDRQDFRKAAETLEGSTDLGAQLLCALLRSAGVTARLVCSLQPLSFTASVAGYTPRKQPSQKVTVRAAVSDGEGTETGGSVATNASSKALPGPSTSSPVMPRRINRIGQARIGAGIGPDIGKAPTIVAPNTRRIIQQSYPVYWVEAFDSARQKWIAVDALTTQTVGKQSRLEPPFNDAVNAMTYVVAFEEDGSAKDVTRRYARAYNAKTRNLRVEATDGGERWLRKALKLFRRRVPLDRDAIEDAELAHKEAAEGMPRNVQDFKKHPYYVLERHLRSGEIIHPMTEVGKVNSGGAASGRLESVYRRKDVHAVRSADKWYRLGREVKAGEQPLKHGKPRRQRRGSLDEMEQGDDEAGVALYAAFQTEMYVPPPVFRGKVPRNAYGNLDVYVPSMVPLGGVHIKSRDAAKAARSLKVDYADAVTGFKFQGRQGTAVVEGVVVAEEHADAVHELIAGFEQARINAAADKRSAELLRLWRRFVVGLRVAERIQEYRDGGDEDVDMEGHDIQDQIDRAEEEDTRVDEAGGFFADSDNGSNPEPTMGTHTGIIANAFPYEDFPSDQEILPTRQQNLLPDGLELVGFEGLALKPVKRPARRLLALEDSDDEQPTQQRSQANSYRRNHPVDSATKGSNEENVPLLHGQGGVDFPHGGSALMADAGGFLPDLDGTDEHAYSTELSDGHVNANVTSPENVSVTQIMTTESGSTKIGANSGRGLDGEGEDLETGSLLSHDPEDEDAEPDWLDV